jgi:uncharacterized damage-inducible protein DinB
MKRVMSVAVAAVVLFVPVLTQAQNPMMTAVKAQHEMAKGVLLKTAEKIPENLYSYRPTPDVRTVAQLIGHIADASGFFCSSASGQKPSAVSAEKTMTTKAQLTKALADAFAYCDKAIADMDDTKAMESIKFFAGGMSPRGMVLSFNTTHNYEHYGNLVTYMRLNKIVPPSSEGQKP